MSIRVMQYNELERMMMALPTMSWDDYADLLTWDAERPPGSATSDWCWWPLILADVPVWRPGRRVLSVEARTAVFARDGFACVHCGAAAALSIDHIHPVAHGGTNDPANLQTLCLPCNSRKGARI